MTTQQVHAVGMAFTPQSITVQPGDTVEWVVDSGTHTVTADDGTFDSGQIHKGNTFSHAFPVAGSYPYYCANHGGPGGIGMSGQVVVTDDCKPVAPKK